MISKKIFLVFVIFSNVFIFNVASAKVLINEVQIETEQSKDNEFIELYNDGSTEVDLTGYSIYKKTSSGSESSFVAKTRFQGIKIQPSGFLFLARDGEYSGSKIPDVLWPNSYSLAFNNSLTLYKNFDDKTIEDSVSWGEVKNFKRSLTSSSTPSTSTESNGNPNNTTATTSGAKISAEEEYKLSTTIYVNKVAIVGIPFEVRASTLNNKGEQIVYGEYFWNFGDGDSKKVKLNSSEKTLHTYFYPGKYLLNVGYYTNDFLEKPDSYSEVYIDVISSDVLLKVIGDAKEFFIELTNNTNLNIDVSMWYIKTGEKVFTIPRNTNLSSKSKITIPGRITSFSFGEKDNLDLYNKQGEKIFESKILSEPKTVAKKTSTGFISKSGPTNYVTPKQNTEDTIIPLTANISDSLETSISKNNFSNKSSLIYFTGFIVLVIVSAVSVFYLRKGSAPDDLDEFEILDE